MTGSEVKAGLEKVMKSHPTIRYTRLISATGESLAMAFAEKDAILEPSGETEVILRRLALAGSMTSGSEGFYGKAHVIVILREKLTELVYLTGKNIVLVGAGPDFPLDTVKELERAVLEVQNEL